VIIDYAGTRYELDTSHISFKHAMVVQSYTGLGIDAWLESTGFEVDAETQTVKNPPPEWLKAIGAMYWLMLAQNDVKAAIAEIDFDVQDFYQAYLTGAMADLERALAEAKAAEAADPTKPSQPSPPDDPPSTGPSTPTGTTPTPRARRAAAEDPAASTGS
jgi:hypothetical protein